MIIGILLIIEDKITQIKNNNNEDSRIFKLVKALKHVNFSNVSLIVKCIKNGPKVKEPIEFIYFLLKMFIII